MEREQHREAQRLAPAIAPSAGGQALPPVNYNSPLIANFGAQPVLASATEQAVAIEAASFNFGRLRTALLIEDSQGEMRKISSAPTALNQMARGMSSPSCRVAANSGGPMRRVSTSITPLTARRAGFVWTMDMHRDFESAVQTLASLGRDVSEVSPAAVLELMKYSGSDGLTELSIERHLQKRASLQHKLRAMLPSPPDSRMHASAAAGQLPDGLQAEAPAIAPHLDLKSQPANAAAASGSSSLAAAMQRQQAMQRAMLEQQRVLQATALTS